MDYSLLAILLAIFGLGLLIAEVFIPSGGLIMVIAVASFLGSIWCGWLAWGETPGYFWTYLAVLLLGIPVVLVGTFAIMPHTSFGRRILLEAPSNEEITPYAEEREYLKQLVGQRGRTISLLNPGGLVLVNNERMHCESQSLMIEPDTEVEVVGVSGNRLVVQEVLQAGESETATTDADESPDSGSAAGHLAQSETTTQEQPPTDESRLDFDIPQG